VIEIAVGFGVLLSLLFMEFLGASAGGIVVPGYIAIHLHNPEFIMGTMIVALATWGIVRLVGKYALVFGQRRMVLSILVGFILGYAARNFQDITPTAFEVQLTSMGFLIPGLIANWFERQGFVKTICSMFITAFLIRILLIILMGGEVTLSV
jgi:poly-gamma-glutamate biosynthesis protein PgsC/CapC